MPRYKCIISYDGSGFSGYQVQPNKRTVQSVLEAVLTKMHKGEARESHLLQDEPMPVSMQKDKSFILIHHFRIPADKMGEGIEFNAT